jgi:hypothetical protein
MLTPIVSNSLLCPFEILSRLPRVFPRRVTEPGNKELELTCLGVTVIFDMVNLILRLVVSSADYGLRWLNISRSESFWTLVVILEIFQVDYGMRFDAIR